jgi:predicted HTH transcriptional regulator
LSPIFFAKVIKTFTQLKVLQESADEINKDIRYFKIETTLIDDLLTFLKQKKYKELQEIIEGKRELVYFEIPDELCKVLNVIIKNESLSKNELAKMAGLTRKRLGDWLVLLKKTGVLMDSFKEDSEDIYIFSSSRSKKVLEYINNGAYEKDKELKQLWKLTNS